MGYSIQALKENGDIFEIDHHFIQRNTFCIDGTTEPTINITSNYSEFLYKVIDGGIKSLHNKKVIDTIKILNKAINKLKGSPDKDYWKPTEGNTKLALIELRELALLILKVDVDAIWRVEF